MNNLGGGPEEIEKKKFRGSSLGKIFLEGPSPGKKNFRDLLEKKKKDFTEGVTATQVPWIKL